MLGSPLQLELDVLLQEEPALLCPITLVLLLDPVIASDGCIYERVAVQELLRIQGPSPMTHRPLSSELLPAQEQRSRAQTFRHERAQELLNFVARARKQDERAMALAALDRAGEYSKVLEDLAPEVAREHRRLCSEMGQPADVAHPQVRLQRMLKTQVMQAKAEAEAVQLGRCHGDAAAEGPAKSLTFTLDCSWSMDCRQRMGKARENLLKIFDQHIQDADHLSMITFADTSKVEFSLREVGASRASLRCTAEAACKCRGQTAFYDAVVDSVKGLAQAPSGHRTWIIALTDGEDNSSRNSLESVWQALRASEAQPALIIIGVQLQERLKPQMQKLCTATEGSLFIDAAGDVSAIDEAFEEVAELICE
jgi:Mg-chelatase subunit ChlD